MAAPSVGLFLAGQSGGTRVAEGPESVVAGTVDYQPFSLRVMTHRSGFYQIL